MSPHKHPTPLRILHAAETTHGGIQAYWDELKSASHLHQNFLFPTGNTRGLKRCWKLAQLLRKTLKEEHHDILFLHSTFAGLVGRLTLLSLPSYLPKIIYCAHGWAFNMKTSTAKKRLYALIERALLPLTDAIVNVSQFEADSAKRYGIKGFKCRTILNGIGDIPKQKNISLPEQKINLLFVGRFHEAKGADLLQHITLQAADTLPHLHFHVVGDAQADNEKTLTFPPNTTCYGWLPREETLPLCAACDALIVPSKWDAFSLVSAEALRAGKALILNNAAALPEFLNKGAQGYLLNMEDIPLTLETLNKLNKTTLREMGQHNRKIYKKHYTAERMNKELITFYEELTSSSQ